MIRLKQLKNCLKLTLAASLLVAPQFSRAESMRYFKPSECNNIVLPKPDPKAPSVAENAKWLAYFMVGGLDPVTYKNNLAAIQNAPSQDVLIKEYTDAPKVTLTSCGPILQNPGNLYSQVNAQILLNQMLPVLPSLADALNAGDYNKAWDIAEKNKMVYILETPIGFRILGIKQFTLAQMKAFYAAAANGNGNWRPLGGNPYTGLEWGEVSYNQSDAETNFTTLNDASYPDLARFAGARPPVGFEDKWLEPIIIMAVTAIATAGVGTALTAGVDAAIDTTAAVVDTGTACTMATTSSLGTLSVGGASTLLGSTLSVGTSMAAGTIVTVAEGQSINGKSIVEGTALGLLGGAALDSSGFNNELTNLTNRTTTNIVDGVLSGSGTSLILNGKITVNSVMSSAVNASISSGISNNNKPTAGGFDPSVDATPVDSTTAAAGTPDYVLPPREELTTVGDNTFAADCSTSECYRALTSGQQEALTGTESNTRTLGDKNLPPMKWDESTGRVCLTNICDLITYISDGKAMIPSPNELMGTDGVVNNIFLNEYFRNSTREGTAQFATAQPATAYMESFPDGQLFGVSMGPNGTGHIVLAQNNNGTIEVAGNYGSNFGAPQTGTGS